MAHTDTSTRPTRRRPTGRLVAVALAVGLLCLMTVGAGTAGAATSQKPVREISTAQDDKLGTILVAGNTVYTLDLSGGTCSAKCLKAWTPVLLASGAKKAKAGDGVDARKLGTVATGDGARQVTYGGDPLYWSTKDKAEGDVHGNVTDKFGTGAVVVTAKASSGSTDTGTGGTAF